MNADICEQLTLDMPITYEVGQTVWWTYGLGYLCCTYKRNAKIRPEQQEQVVITSIIVDESPCGYTDEPRTTYKIYSSESEREFHVHSRWLSASSKYPCEAVNEAYSIWGN